MDLPLCVLLSRIPPGIHDSQVGDGKVLGHILLTIGRCLLLLYELAIPLSLFERSDYI